MKKFVFIMLSAVFIFALIIGYQRCTNQDNTQEVFKMDESGHLQLRKKSITTLTISFPDIENGPIEILDKKTRDKVISLINSLKTTGTCEGIPELGFPLTVKVTYTNGEEIVLRFGRSCFTKKNENFNSRWDSFNTDLDITTDLVDIFLPIYHKREK